MSTSHSQSEEDKERFLDLWESFGMNLEGRVGVCQAKKMVKEGNPFWLVKLMGEDTN